MQQKYSAWQACNLFPPRLPRGTSTLCLYSTQFRLHVQEDPEVLLLTPTQEQGVAILLLPRVCQICQGRPGVKRFQCEKARPYFPGSPVGFENSVKKADDDFLKSVPPANANLRMDAIEVFHPTYVKASIDLSISFCIDNNLSCFLLRQNSAEMLRCNQKR